MPKPRFSLDSAPLTKYQLKHERTRQNLLQVVRLASSALKACLHTSYEICTSEKGDGQGKPCKPQHRLYTEIYMSMVVK